LSLLASNLRQATAAAAAPNNGSIPMCSIEAAAGSATLTEATHKATRSLSMSWSAVLYYRLSNPTRLLLPVTFLYFLHLL
jgi:hypothetical protein